MMPDVRGVLDRLVRTDILSGSVFWTTLAFTIVGTILGNVSLFARAGVPAMAALLMAHGATYLYLVALLPLLRAAPATRQRYLLPLLLAVVSVLRGITYSLMLRWIGLESVTPWLQRVSGSIFVVGLGFVVSMMVASSISEHRALITSLVERQGALHAAREDVERGITERATEAAARIQGILQSRIDTIRERSPQAAAEEMRRTVGEVIRPLSHELARPAPLSSSSRPATPTLATDWAALVSDATSGRPLNPWAMTIWLSVFCVGWAWNNLSGRAAIWLSLGGPVIGGLGCYLANLALERVNRNRGPWLRALTTTAALALVGLLTGVTARTEFVDYPEHLGMVTVGGLVLFPSLGWVIAVIASAGRQRRRVEAEMRQLESQLEWELARARELHWQQRRALARALHGPVQSAIGRAALKLERAVAEAQPGKVREIVESLHESLGDAVDLLSAPRRPLEIPQVLEEIAQTYAGVCAVEWSLAPDASRRLELDQAAAVSTAEILTEAVWNAVRHGKAERVRIDVQLTSTDRITLAVDNDGTRPMSGGERGLGSQLLDEVTLAWSRFEADGWTRLQAELPSSEPAGNGDFPLPIGDPAHLSEPALAGNRPDPGS